MNEHIKPIFEKVIPKIQSANIKYWVYGGIAYAAMVGRCYRNNPDVDLFVLKDDFDKTEEILEKLCNENGWKICKTFLNSRPKIEISILKNKKKWIERLSIAPAYLKNNQVELKFREGSEEYPLHILNQEKKSLDGFDFFAISDTFLKSLFIEYLDSKRKYPSKRIEDARYILTKEEFTKYFPNENYD